MFAAGKSAGGGQLQLSCGRNRFGQLGVGTSTGYQTSFVQVAILSGNSVSVTGRLDTGYIRQADGTLWAWGNNSSGEVGIGNTTSPQTLPVQIGTSSDWISVAGGNFHALAIKSDGTLWAWGRNTNGQLGIGSTTQQTSPVQVGTDTSWASVACGGSHTLAIKSDGTLWAWGANTLGQLGLGNTLPVTSPQQVGSGTDWSVVIGGDSFSVGIKTDGTLWAWGRNDAGQLGIGTTGSPQTTPVQVGTDTNWSNVSSGANHSLAIKSTGTLWAWGGNSQGEAGIGNTTTPQTSPVQVGSDTDWSIIAAGNRFSLAVKTNGVLWAWGINEYGQLGIGNTTTPQTTPVQVITGVGWTAVNGLFQTSLGILA